MTIKKLLTTLTLFITFYVLHATSSLAATYKISPSSATFTQGCNYAVDVLMDTDNKSSNAGDILINYDPNKIEIAEVEPGTTYSNYFGNIVNSTAGTIRLTGASFNTPFNGNGVFATILFKPKVNTGNTDFKIFYTGANAYNTLDSNIADTTSSTDLLSGVQNGFYGFTSGRCVDDHVPPTVNFITPVNNQTGIPSDANIVVNVSDSGSGVDVGLVRITINGIVYTVKNSQVILTGDTTNYGFTVKPTSPLNSNSPNTVLVNATDIAGNSTQQLITFNLPSSTISTVCIIPSDTPTATPTSAIGQITTTLTTTPTVSTTATPTRLPQPTPTPTPIIDHQSPSIEFIKPISKDTISLSPEIIFKVDDPDSGINYQSVQITLNGQIITYDTPGFSSKGSKFTANFNYQVKDPLLANTNYTISIFASDNAGNGLSKSIIVRTNTPFSTKVFGLIKSIPGYTPSLLMIIFISGIIGYLLTIINSLNHRHNTPYGQVADSTTLEPFPNFLVKVFDDQNKYIKSARTNIFGIFSFSLNPGKYQFVAANTTSEIVTISAESDIFLNLNIIPTFTPQDDRLVEPLNQFLVLTKFRLPPHGFVFNSQGHLRSGIKINLIDPGTKNIISSRITNQIGQYRFLVPHGRYLVDIVESPQATFIVDTRHLTTGYTTINRNLFL